MNDLSISGVPACTLCFNCLETVEKAWMTESQKTCCQECFLQLGQEPCVIKNANSSRKNMSMCDAPRRVKSHQSTKIRPIKSVKSNEPKDPAEPLNEISKSVNRLKFHQPTKLKTTEPLKIPPEPLQAIPKSFFDNLTKLSKKEGAMKVNELLKNTHLLCVAQETKTYALTRRSDGRWSFGFIVDVDPKNITVCYNLETKDGKYVPLESSLALPPFLMQFIDSQVFNTANELSKCEKRFTPDQLVSFFIEWSNLKNFG